MKKCTKCSQTKSICEFYKGFFYKGLYRTRCKVCEKEYLKLWREKNKEYLKSWRKRWIEKNKEKLIKQKRHWFEKNKEKSIEKNRIWKEKNPEKVKWLNRLQQHKRRCAGKIDREAWIKKVKILGEKCLMCGVNQNTAKLTIDHIIPISKGGTNEITNLQPLCSFCNRRKHTKSIDFTKVMCIS